LDDDSPYPEVRSAVSNVDDPAMAVSTLRVWVIGLGSAIIIAAINQLFWLRYPSVDITTIVAQLLTYPVGRAAAAYLPRWRVLGIELNPGPFTIKEHVLATVRHY
jgi:hypothetical protein